MGLLPFQAKERATESVWTQECEDTHSAIYTGSIYNGPGVPSLLPFYRNRLEENLSCPKSNLPMEALKRLFLQSFADPRGFKAAARLSMRALKA